MARPIKNNAEYFTHDADMRNDLKVRALRRAFGHKGYAAWCFILETLTDADYFRIEYNSLTQELMAADYELSVDDLTEIIEYCVKIGLLQRNGDTLYSDAHKERLSGLVTNRERKRARFASYVNNNGIVSACQNPAETPDSFSNGVSKPHSKEKEKKIKEKKEEIVYPCQQVVDLWNEICISLPKVRLLTDSRKHKIKIRLDEFGKPETWLSFTEALFRRVQASDFLRGANSKWTATFDWIFENEKNWLKVQEGNYDNDRCDKKPVTGLGVGEYIDSTAKRTYGSGKADIPFNAEPRPSERHQWDAGTERWVIL